MDICDHTSGPTEGPVRYDAPPGGPTEGFRGMDRIGFSASKGLLVGGRFRSKGLTRAALIEEALALSGRRGRYRPPNGTLTPSSPTLC
jgi:hypothetical protein